MTLSRFPRGAPRRRGSTTYDAVVVETGMIGIRKGEGVTGSGGTGAGAGVGVLGMGNGVSCDCVFSAGRRRVILWERTGVASSVGEAEAAACACHSS